MQKKNKLRCCKSNVTSELNMLEFLENVPELSAWTVDVAFLQQGILIIINFWQFSYYIRHFPTEMKEQSLHHKAHNLKRERRLWEVKEYLSKVVGMIISHDLVIQHNVSIVLGCKNSSHLPMKFSIISQLVSCRCQGKSRFSEGAGSQKG